MKNSLLDRYLYAVGKSLPANQREDILKELASTLSETAEEQQDGRAAEDVMADVIRTFGEPSEVGARYTGRLPVLIGPNLYSTYLMVLKLVWLIAGIVLLIVFSVSLAFGNLKDQSIPLLINMLTTVFQTGMMSFATVTAIFALMERAQTSKTSVQEQAWDPATLPDIPRDTTPIKPVGEVLSICFSLFFLYLLHNRYQHFGLVFQITKNGWNMEPLFRAESLSPWVWPATLILVLAVVLSAAKLIRGRWTTWMHVLTALSDVAIAALFLLFFNTPDILSESLDAKTILALTLSLRITAVAVAVPLIIDAFKHVILSVKVKTVVK